MTALSFLRPSVARWCSRSTRRALAALMVGGLACLSALAAPAGAKLVYEFQNGVGKQAGFIPMSAPLVEGEDLIGTTRAGGIAIDFHDGGTVYRLRNTGKGGWKHGVLYQFDPAGALGFAPWAGLTKGGDGKYYGVTLEGAAWGQGAVYRLTPGRGGWSGELVHAFTGDEGGFAHGELAFDAQGNLFGTLSQGGQPDCGALFELHKNGSDFDFRIVHRFVGGADGCYSSGRPVFDAAGTLYGSTMTTVYRVKTPSANPVFEVLHTLTGTEGWDSQGGLSIDQAGNLYGTSNWGPDSARYGTVFKLTPAGDAFTFEVLHTFTGHGLSSPHAPAIADAAGNLYGTASLGAYLLARRADGSYAYRELAQISGYDTLVLAPLVFAADGSVLYGQSLGALDNQSETNGRIFSVKARRQ